MKSTKIKLGRCLSLLDFNAEIQLYCDLMALNEFLSTSNELLKKFKGF